MVEVVVLLVEAGVEDIDAVVLLEVLVGVMGAVSGGELSVAAGDDEQAPIARDARTRTAIR